MLIYNIRRLISVRGISKPTVFLSKLGFNFRMASLILNGKTAGLKLKHIERLCKGLKCTPNDLYEWIPEEGESETGFPLAGLKRDKEIDLHKTIGKFTLEELERILPTIGKEE